LDPPGCRRHIAADVVNHRTTAARPEPSCKDGHDTLIEQTSQVKYLCTGGIERRGSRSDQTDYIRTLTRAVCSASGSPAPQPPAIGNRGAGRAKIPLLTAEKQGKSLIMRRKCLIANSKNSVNSNA
jgi:hypothetical protein